MTERKKPYIIEVEAGTKAFCQCGDSKNLPYCDGSHKGTEFRPYVEKFEASSKIMAAGIAKNRDNILNAKAGEWVEEGIPPYCN